MSFLWAAMVCLALSGPTRAASIGPLPRPNIVFILLDDLDIADVGAYGGKDIATKTMDQLARQGMRFTQFYANGPVCSPTRASILTGHYPARYGIKRAVVRNSFRGIPSQVPVMAEMLKQAGYRTAHIGKWHVGTNKVEFLPTSKGFDHSVRMVGHSYSKYLLSVDDARPQPDRHRRHLTRALTDYALRFIDKSLKEDTNRPFFLNLWYFAPHDPIEVPPDFDNSLTHYCLSGGSCRKGRSAYAAVVTYVDRQIQRILDHLDQRGVSDRTLVVLASDNGGTKHWHQDLPWRPISGFKASLMEGGIRVPLIVRWPGVVPAGTVNRSVTASFDLFPTLADITGLDDSRYSLDGKSFLGVLTTGRTKQRPGPLFWENKRSNHMFFNNSGIFNTYAVRWGDWKLLFNPATAPGDVDKTQLYDLRTDEAETDNMAATDTTQRSLDVLGHRFSVSRVDTHTNESAARYAKLIDQLQHLYYRWRETIGSIDYQAAPSNSGVRTDGGLFRFSGGVVTIPRDARLDFNDADFSLVTVIRSENLDDTATIAEKPRSWRLSVEGRHVRLEVIGQPDQGQGLPQAKRIELAGPKLEPGAHHIAFTVYGWRASPSTIRLYVDGTLVDEAVGADSVSRVNSFDRRDEPMLYIGNDQNRSTPFHGVMTPPRLSVLALYPSEIFWDFAKASRGKSRASRP